MDEVFIRIQGVQHYLWRAVDQNSVVRDILVHARRDDESCRCNGSNCPNKPRTFSPPIPSSTVTFVRVDTDL